MTLAGATLAFDAAGVVALAGAVMAAAVDGVPVTAGTPFRVAAGSTLELGAARRGARTYLAVRGGIDVPLLLGSRSTYLRAAFGGFEGRALRAGDRLPVGAPPADPPPPLPAGVRMPDLPEPGSVVELRVILGPQDDRFGPEGLETLLGNAWKVTSLNDRMGYRLEGPTVRHREGADIVTDAVIPGAVQVAGDGKPIVLMADCQTTGGYAKPFTVIGPDLRRLAQARAGDRVRFRRCTQDDAAAALAEERAWPST